MAFPKASDSGGKDFEILEPGSYAAVCTWIVSIGLQPTGWGPKEKIKLRFEVPSERVTWEKDGVEEEGPMVIWATYTNSLSEKAILRKDLEAWRGRPFTKEELEGFDLGKVAGAPCLISVVHREGQDGKTYANISSIGKLPKGMEVPKPEGEIVGFDIRNFSQEEYDALPEWLQRRIDDGLAEMEAQEELAKPPAPDKFVDDDIPF